MTYFRGISMLLVIDVGNTNIVLGLFQHSKLIRSWRVSTSRNKTSDEYGILFLSLLEHRSVPIEEIEGVVISSVVPPLNPAMTEVSERYFRRKPLWVGPGIKTGIPIQYDNPKEVGADRIVNAVAAYERYQKAGIVVDFGTATTFDAIGPNGEYLGGAIAPGIRISAEALFLKASKLPRVEIEPPPQVIGKNTVQSIQSGLFFGYVGLVDGIVTRMKAELGQDCFVVATGGLAPIIAKESKTIAHIEPDLTLWGLYSIYRKNRNIRGKKSLKK